MRNKILIIESNPLLRNQFEESFQEILAQGGELFFTSDTREGIALLQKEKPQLIFLEFKLGGGDFSKWRREGSHLVLLADKGDTLPPDVDFLIKPLQERQLQEKCGSLHLQEPVPPILPM
jgi:DNA-binding LytR/AlgR family response regulator